MTLSEPIMDFYRILLGGFVSKLIVALLFLFIGLIFGKILGRAVHKLLSELDFDSHIEKLGFKQKLTATISTWVSFLIYFLSVYFALMQFGLAGPVFYTLIVLFLIIFAVSAMLTVKEFFPNFFSFIHIKFNHVISVGELVKIENVEGKVEHIGFTKTKIKTRKGDTIFLNNMTISKSPVKKLKK